MTFQPIGRLQISEAIRKLNPLTFTSTDGISMKLIKTIQSPLIPVITHLVNTVIMITKYPTILKKKH